VTREGQGYDRSFNDAELANACHKPFCYPVAVDKTNVAAEATAKAEGKQQCPRWLSDP
jgi:hypothetical protein